MVNTEESIAELDEMWELVDRHLPPSDRSDRLRIWKQNLEWLSRLGQTTRLLIAAIAPENFTICHANRAFCQLIGIAPIQDTKGSNGHSIPVDNSLLERLKNPDRDCFEGLYRRHLLCRILQQRYEIDIEHLLGLDEPAIATFHSPQYQQPRAIEYWLNTEGITISPIDPQLDEFADLKFKALSGKPLQSLEKEGIKLEKLEKELRLDNYRIEGLLLLEGVDITLSQIIQKISQILITSNSILRPKKFRQINKHLRTLFGADNTFILSAERDPARLFIETESGELSVTSYGLESLKGSHFLRSVEENQVWNVRDLSAECNSKCEKQLVKVGVRSLLLIPLVVKTTESDRRSRQMVGFVGLTSDRPHHFNAIDIRHATQLIPAFTVALRQVVQQRLTRFTNIHASVEWRFVQELERRSWGLAPEAIVFTNLYPLYGISDIRGSSDERNRAIQTDLLAQFQLAIAVVEAVCQQEHSAFVEQLRLDLRDRIEQIQSGVTLDAEATALQYLKERLEVYFDHFAFSSTAAAAAVTSYREACDNEHQCIYAARSRYDETVSQINESLRETWERWQVKMQKIIPHYCDVECTDGIDHMMYIGASIDKNFSQFHLHSLRYDQLRAVCDCARTALKIQQDYQTPMQVTHLVLVQDSTVDIFHDEKTERLFDVRGTRDTRYEIVKKRIDKGVEERTGDRITQPGMLTVVYSTQKEWEEYEQYLRYLVREGWVAPQIEFGNVEPLPGVSGLKFARLRVLPEPNLSEESDRNGSKSVDRE